MGPDSAVTHIKGFESAHSVEKVANFNQNQYQMRNMQFRNIAYYQTGKVANSREKRRKRKLSNYLVMMGLLRNSIKQPRT